MRTYTPPIFLSLSLTHTHTRSIPILQMSDGSRGVAEALARNLEMGREALFKAPIPHALETRERSNLKLGELFGRDKPYMDLETGHSRSLLGFKLAARPVAQWLAANENFIAPAISLSVGPDAQEATIMSHVPGVIIRDTESGEANHFHMALSLSLLYEKGYTPNICPVFGMDVVYDGPRFQYPSRLDVYQHAPPSGAVYELQEFFLTDNPLRKRLGLPTVEEQRAVSNDPATSLRSDTLERLNDLALTETGPLAEMVTNMVHQITATLAVLEQQCEGMLCNIGMSSVRLVDLKALKDTTGGSNVRWPAYGSEGTSLARSKFFEYRIIPPGGDEFVTLRVPNLGFLVLFSDFRRASATFDYRRFPGHPRKPIAADRRDYQIYRFARIAQRLSPIKPTEGIVHTIGLAPTHWVEYWRMDRSQFFVANYDLSVLFAMFSQLTLGLLYKQFVVRKYYAIERKLHAVRFGDLRYFQAHTIDESLMLGITKDWKIPAQAEFLFRGTLILPLGVLCLSPAVFIESGIFLPGRAQGDTMRTGDAGDGFAGALPAPEAPPASVIPKVLSDYTATSHTRKAVNLTNLRDMGNMNTLRDGIEMDSVKLQLIIGNTLVTDDRLSSLSKSSDGFIASGAQGMIHAVLINAPDGKGAPTVAALKSFSNISFFTRFRKLSSAFRSQTESNLETYEILNELLISAMISELYERGISPNFIHTHAIFSATYRLSVEDWITSAANLVNSVAAAIAGQSDKTPAFNYFIDLVVKRIYTFFPDLRILDESTSQLAMEICTEGLYKAIGEAASSGMREEVQIFEALVELLSKVGTAPVARTAAIACVLVACDRIDTDVSRHIEARIKTELDGRMDIDRVSDAVTVGSDEAMPPADNNFAEPRRRGADDHADEHVDNVDTADEEKMARIERTTPSQADTSILAGRIRAWADTQLAAASAGAATFLGVIDKAARLQLETLKTIPADASMPKFHSIMELIDGDMVSLSTRIVPKLQAMLARENWPFHRIPDVDQYTENALSQVTMALATFQAYFAGMHNDAHPGNFFVKLCDSTLFAGKKLSAYEHFEYTIGAKKVRIPNMGFVIKLADPGHSSITLRPPTVSRPAVLMAPPRAPKPLIVGDPNKNLDYVVGMKRVHKYVSKNVVGWFTRKATSILDSLKGSFPEWMRNAAAGYSPADISRAFAIGESIRSMGSFVPSFDLATVMNNMSANPNFYRHPAISDYVAREIEREMDKYPTLPKERIFRRFLPNAFTGFLKHMPTTYLPRSVRYIMSPYDMMERWAAWKVPPLATTTATQMFALGGPESSLPTNSTVPCSVCQRYAAKHVCMHCYNASARSVEARMCVCSHACGLDHFTDIHLGL